MSNKMPKIAHITDLHSGRHDPEVVEALIASLAEQKPDLIVIGGDLTQRSRRAEWHRAVGWLERMPAPWIATPGNHDIPMFDFPRRAVSPFGRFNEFVGEELEPSANLGGALILCVRTATPRRRVEGAVDRESLALVSELLHARGGASPVVLVTHHPLALHPATGRSGHNVIGGDQLLEVAGAGGVDLLLSGHTHRPHGGTPFAVEVGGRAMVASHGGTACSTRTRSDESPAWQMVDLSPDRIEITMHEWDQDGFRQAEPSLWLRAAGGWEPSA